MNNNYLIGVIKQFEYYRLLGNKTFEQLSDDELIRQPSLESNSIAIIVKHLNGNMKSRFSDFLTSDGEKEWRNRDNEFEGDVSNRLQLISLWEEGWNMVFKAIDQVEDLDAIVYIRNQGHTVTEAMNRQMAHYAYHVGQIVFIGKLYKGRDWQCLSIPKGGSKNYNKLKFEKKKKRGHFTDEFLDPKA